ncbi:MAG TPA: copper resistance CopC family protein [Xanthobacteraceae bacterium]|nr:copper resistance CopC family protein [Xanthobacteraceae bacterium]
MRNKSIAFAFLALNASAMPAAAHASLDHSDPRVGNTVKSSPSAVTLWFTQRLEPAFSSAQVTNASGAVVSTGASVSGTVMRLGVRSLPPGTYRVHWKVLSVDTHTTEGNFTFRVGQ